MLIREAFWDGSRSCTVSVPLDGWGGVGGQASHSAGNRQSFLFYLSTSRGGAGLYVVNVQEKSLRWKIRKFCDTNSKSHDQIGKRKKCISNLHRAMKRYQKHY